MTALFADTFFYLALFNRSDAHHARVAAFLGTYTGAILTTQFVLMEVADACAGIPERSLVQSRFATLASDPGTTIIPASGPLFDRGLTLFNARPDKEWSLTDCASFCVMHDSGVSDALTGDHHFSQAGFTILF